MIARIFLGLAMLLGLQAGAFSQAGWTVTNTSNETLKFETFEPARGT